MSFTNLSFAALPFHEQAVLILLILISVGSLGVLLYNGFLQAQERLSESLRRRAKREAYSMGHTPKAAQGRSVNGATTAQDSDASSPSRAPSLTAGFFWAEALP